jgi:DNA processing protein
MFLHGRLPTGPVVALVGTRKPSAAAVKYTEELAYQLTRAGVAVASGGAQGIDTAAHRGALNAGGQTLVVAPCSYDRPFPEENTALYEEVVRSGGGFISPFERGVPAQTHAFFARNAQLVAMSSAVVVVEAPIRSGARNAALWARRLSRPLFAVPHAPWERRGAGCLLEIKLGASVLCSARDVLARLQALNLHAIPTEPTGVDTELDLQAELF